MLFVAMLPSTASNLVKPFLPYLTGCVTRGVAVCPPPPPCFVLCSLRVWCRRLRP